MRHPDRQRRHPVQLPDRDVPHLRALHRIRASASICANAIFGGTASFIATVLIALTGSSIAPAWYMVGVAAIALVAMILSHENTDKDLNHI